MSCVPVSPALPVIAVDLDEVLGAFLPALVNYHNLHYSPPTLKFSDYFTYAFGQVWNVSQKEQIRRVHEFALDPEVGLHTLPTIPGALQVLNKYRNDFDFHIVTARSGIFQEISEKWAETHFPGIFRSIFCCNEFGPANFPRASKAQRCREIGAKMIIDDSIGNCLSVSPVVEKALLFDLDGSYLWNGEAQLRLRGGRLPLNVHRVSSWAGVEEFLKNMKNKEQQENKQEETVSFDSSPSSSS